MGCPKSFWEFVPCHGISTHLAPAPEEFEADFASSVLKSKAQQGLGFQTLFTQLLLPSVSCNFQGWETLPALPFPPWEKVPRDNQPQFQVSEHLGLKMRCSQAALCPSALPRYFQLLPPSCKGILCLFSFAFQAWLMNCTCLCTFVRLQLEVTFLLFNCQLWKK